MRSKTSAKSNGRPDMNKPAPLAKPVKQVISKRASQPATKPEPPKPRRKFDIGNYVSIPQEHFGTTNARITGYEWGGEHRRFMRNVWLYYVVPAGADPGHEMLLIAEDQIFDRISI